VIEAHIELERARGRSPENDAAYVQAGHSIAGALVNRVAFRRMIGRISAPTLIVHGEADRLVRADAARKAQRRRRDWELHVLDDVGHIPMLEVPYQFLEILNAWLPSHVLESPRRPVAPEPASSGI
jgi:pimeloyl-ACP methyl ester carboxylesterase